MHGAQAARQHSPNEPGGGPRLGALALSPQQDLE
jgi:hypothetical protein